MFKNLYIRSLLIILALSCMGTIEAGVLYDYHTDTLTYGQYQRGEWQQLYDTVEKAEKSGYSFKYLWQRAGFAAFYLKKYNKAVSFFQEAERFTKGNITVRQYHYLSAFYSQQKKEAYRVYTTFSQEEKTQLNLPLFKPIGSITLEFGYTTNKDIEALKKQDVKGAQGLYGEANLSKNSYYQNILLTHIPFSRVVLKHAFSSIQINRLQFIQNTENIIYPTKTGYFQYFVNPVISLTDDFAISPAFTYIQYDTKRYKVSYLTQQRKYEIESVHSNKRQQVYTLAATYQRLLFNARLSAFYTQNSGITTQQYSGELLIFPFKKNNLYVGLGGHYLLDETGKKHFVAGAKIGGHLKYISLGLTYIKGDLQNYIEANGLVIYNTSEQGQQRFGVNLTFPLKKSKLYFLVYYNSLEYVTDSFYFDSQLPLKPKKIHHTNDSWTLGLSFYL